MPESSDLQSLIEAAQRAAATGDYPSAQGCLRTALRLQEVALGPSHPDLANTLNNLAVVCEMANQLGEAEACYRRAFAIAAASLDSNHPSVATSRQNLVEFCEAQGVPLDLSPPPVTDVVRSAPAPVTPPVADPPPPWKPRIETVDHLFPPARSDNRRARVPTRVDSTRHPATPFSRRFAIGVAAVGALAFVVVAAVRPWSSDTEPTAIQPAPAVESAVDKTPPAAPRNRPAPTRGSTAATATSPVTVVDAQLCADLSTASGTWNCTPAGETVSPGRLTFYTRIKSFTQTVVEHRWYRGAELRQSADLPVGANPTAGYRTYSRYTIDDQSAGAWRVELRTKAGKVLHQQRFVVR